MKTTVLAFASLLVAIPRLHADDTSPPEITSVSIVPSTVEVGSSAEIITVHLEITDDQSGFLSGNLFIYNSDGDFVKGAYFDGIHRVSGDSLDGEYQVDVEIPQSAEPGTWRADAYTTDFSGNIRNYGPNSGNTPFPVPADTQFEVTNSDLIDSTAPFLDSFSISPTQVETGGGPATLAIQVECSDDLSGFDYGLVYPHDPNGFLRVDLIKFFNSSELTSGDGFSGTYEIAFELPQGAEPGTWTFELYLKDIVGNGEFHPGGDAEVLSSLGTNTFLARALDAFQFQWSTSGGGWIMETEESNDDIDAAASLPIVDDQSCLLQTTVVGPGTLSFDWKVSSEEDFDILSVSIGENPPELEISGETFWTSESISIPPGPQTIVWRYSKDGSDSQGDDRGWVDRVRFTSTSDQSLPIIQDLRISPRAADVTVDPQDLTFTFEVTDDLNGLEEGRIELFDPSGNPHISTTFDSNNRIDGDSLAGTYEVTLPVSESSQTGSWYCQIELTESSSSETRLFGPDGDSFPVSGMEYFEVVAVGTNDAEPPSIRELSITPGTVDISSGEATLIVTLRATDPIAGLEFGDISVYTPTDDWTGSVYFDEYSRIAGDEHDGIYQVEVPVPAYGQPGTWRIASYLRDWTGNEQEYPYDLEFDPGIEETFEVENTGPVDYSAPVVTSIDITPGAIDTSEGDQDIQITVSLQDDLSGIRDSYLFFYDPNGVFQGSMFVTLDSGDLISGTRMDGTYQVTQAIPGGSLAGTWEVRVYLRDFTGNTATYGTSGEDYPEPGDGLFMVSSGTLDLYSAYIQAFGLTGNDALPGADPDHDGLCNALELLLGTHPNDASENGTGLIALTSDSNGLHFEFTVDPVLNVTVDGNSILLEDGSGGAPMRVTGQKQNQLNGTWSEVLPTHVSGSVWRITVPFSGGATGFARLMFETP